MTAFLFPLSLFTAPALAGQVDGWVMAGSRPNSYAMDVDTEILHSGTASARLASTANRILGFGTMMQNFSPEKYLNKRVQMSGWVRSLDVEEWAGLWMRVDGDGLLPLAFDNMSDRPVQGSTDWTRHSIVLDVPEEATNIAFGILLNGTGTVWLDDLEFTVVTDVPTTNTQRDEPANLGFEQ